MITLTERGLVTNSRWRLKAIDVNREKTISSCSSSENVILKLQNHTNFKVIQFRCLSREALCLASSLWGKLSQTIVCNLLLENAFPGLYNLETFLGSWTTQPFRPLQIYLQQFGIS